MEEAKLREVQIETENIFSGIIGISSQDRMRISIPLSLSFPSVSNYALSRLGRLHCIKHHIHITAGRILPLESARFCRRVLFFCAFLYFFRRKCRYILAINL